jgi:hypothetical protein
LRIHGPFHSFDAYLEGMKVLPIVLPTAGLRQWTTGAVVPLIPSPKAATVFLKMYEQPRLDASGRWQFRPIQGDLNATTGKTHMVMEPKSVEGLWPVYKGASFNLWQPNTGEVYAWAKPAAITKVLQDKRLTAVGKSNSVFFALGATWAHDKSTLPCLRPRIAFRDVARATDSRTVICALIPPEVVVSHTAPYLLRVAGDERDEAYLLGVMSSIPFDWMARRIVETHVTFDLFNAFPVPRPDRPSTLWEVVVNTAGRFAAVDDRYSTWAEQLSVPVGSIGSTDREPLIGRLDAAVALLYGLDPDQVTILYETFHEGWNYRPRLAATLDAMADLSGANA